MEPFRSRSPLDTIHAGARLAATLRGGEVLAISAPLGAGKTVFVKGLARGFGVREIVTSPTYTIISEYAGRVKLVHVDLYRIDNEDEYEQLAIDEYVRSDTVIAVEWPERAGGLLPLPLISVTIAIGQQGDRLIAVAGPSPDHAVTGDSA